MRVQPLSWKTLQMKPYINGFLENNTYVLSDIDSGDCVIIDPSFHFELVLADMQKNGLQPREYWLTHGHFDHFIGIGCPEALDLKVPCRMHALDNEIFREGGESARSEHPLTKNCPFPQLPLEDGMLLNVGAYAFKVLLTPGHSPGHCCFYCAEAGWLFSGDLVFYQSYGRTDLMGGDTDALFQSIREKVLTLPDDTLIFPGHNDFTVVKDERPIYS